MQYLALKDSLSKFVVFSLSDIRKLESGFDRRRLSEWQQKGYIKKIRRGWYCFSDLEVSEETLFLIANRVYSPSYVSLESALSYYGLIPEGVFSVTSVSTARPVKFNCSLASFSYKSVKPELFFGYRLNRVLSQSYKIATPEKAILDYLYLNSGMSSQAAFREWRIDQDVFEAICDRNRFDEYLTAFDSPSLNRRARAFMRYMEEASSSAYA